MPLSVHRAASFAGAAGPSAARPEPRDDEEEGQTEQKKKDRAEWGPRRLAVAGLIEHKYFDMTMGLVIAGNMVVMALDANANVDCEFVDCGGLLLRAIGYVMLTVYTCEVGLRAFAFRRKILHSSWDLLDACVVTVGILDVLVQMILEQDTLPETSMLRMFRLLRLVRAVRLIEICPALRDILKGFISSLQAMFWGSLTILVLLLMFSIFAVEFVYPRSKAVNFESAWCLEAFSSVQSAVVFFFANSLVGESWESCVIPLVVEHWTLLFFFAAVLFLIQLGIMNVILSAIVEQANAAHERDIEARFQAAVEEEAMHVQQLGPVFREIDADGSGALSISEVMAAYDRDHRLQHIFKLLGIDRDSLSELFHLMDADGNGTIGQDEFVKAMCQTHKTDIRTQVMATKLQLSSIGRALHRKVDTLPDTFHRISKSNSSLELGPEVPFLQGTPSDQPSCDDGACSGARKLLTRVSEASVSADGVLAALEAELKVFMEGMQSRIISPAGMMGESLRSSAKSGGEPSSSCCASSTERHADLEKCKVDVAAVQAHAAELEGTCQVAQSSMSKQLDADHSANVSPTSGQGKWRLRAL